VDFSFYLAFMGIIAGIWLFLRFVLHREFSDEIDHRLLKQNADLLETYILASLAELNRHHDNPAFRWRLKVGLIHNHIVAYAWRHVRRHSPDSPLLAIVMTRRWSHLKDEAIVEEARAFVSAALLKEAVPYYPNNGPSGRSDTPPR